MQGVFDKQGGRFPSKKAFKESIANGDQIALEATSLFGNEYDGPVFMAPAGTFYIVGPDPYTSRKWYAQLIVAADGTARVK